MKNQLKELMLKYKKDERITVELRALLKHALMSEVSNECQKCSHLYVFEGPCGGKKGVIGCLVFSERKVVDFDTESLIRFMEKKSKEIIK